MGRKPQPIINGEKKCTRCNKSKSINEFNSDKRVKSGYRSYCKLCLHEVNTKDREKVKEWNQISYENYQNKSFSEFGITKARIAWMKIKYSMSPEKYIELLNIQNKSCAICTKPFYLSQRNQKKIHIDHCHSTGKVRGILCNDCNRGLGGFKDNSEYLLNAINYLKMK